MNTDKILHSETSEVIIGAAMKVLNTLRPGLDEKAYENALRIELLKRGHLVDQQKRFDVLYDGQRVDTLVPHLIVDDVVIVDPKVTEDFNATHTHKCSAILPSRICALPYSSTSSTPIFAGSAWSDDPSVFIREIRG